MGDPDDGLSMVSCSFKRKQKVVCMFEDTILIHGCSISFGNPRIITIRPDSCDSALIWQEVSGPESRGRALGGVERTIFSLIERANTN